MKYLKKFFDFFPTPRFLKFSSVGVDVSPDILHYAEIVGEGSEAKLGRFGSESFERGDNILSNASLKSALEKLRKEKKIKYVKASLPEDETYLFTIPVSGASDKEIRNEIEFHLEENVPLSGGDVLFDYYKAPKDGGQMSVVVSVVPKEVVDRYTTLFTDCGITPISFLVESGALSRSIIKRGDKETTLLVYLSHEKSILAVANKGFVEFSSTSKFGGSVFNTAIQKELRVDEEEARRIKYARGLLKPDDKGDTLSDSLANAMSVLKDEMQRVMMYWQKRENAPKITKVIVCGKDSAMPGLPDYLSVALKLPVEVGDVWCNISYYEKSVPPISFEESLSYGTALGLVISQ